MARVVGLTLNLALVAAIAASLSYGLFFRDDPVAERFYCRFFVCANDGLAARAHSALWVSGQQGFESAISDYSELVRREPASMS